MDTSKIKTLLEYCEEVGFKDPQHMSKNNFINAINLYESAYKIDVPTFIEGRYVNYVCPITGTLVRRIKVPKDYKISNIVLEDVELIDEVEEVIKLNRGVNTVVNQNTTQLLAELTKAQGQTLVRMIDNLVIFNNGVITFNDREDYKSFKRQASVLVDRNIVLPVDNKLPKGRYYSYRIAPYLSYKGNEGVYESLLRSWFIQVARITAKRIHHDFPFIDPMSPNGDNFTK